MTAARIGTFDDLLAMTPEPLRSVAVALRETVVGVHPEVTEVVRLGERAATYGIGPRKMIEGYAYIMPQANWVNLGFYRGTSLPDPEGLLEGTGAALRHVKVRRPEDASREGVAALLRAALDERREALGG